MKAELAVELCILSKQFCSSAKSRWSSISLKMSGLNKKRFYFAQILRPLLSQCLSLQSSSEMLGLVPLLSPLLRNADACIQLIPFVNVVDVSSLEVCFRALCPYACLLLTDWDMVCEIWIKWKKFTPSDTDMVGQILDSPPVAVCSWYRLSKTSKLCNLRVVSHQGSCLFFHCCPLILEIEMPRSLRVFWIKTHSSFLKDGKSCH